MPGIFAPGDAPQRMPAAAEDDDVDGDDGSPKKPGECIFRFKNHFGQTDKSVLLSYCVACLIGLMTV